MRTEQLPPVGLGLDTDTDEETNSKNVEHALESGYRHIDTAQWYGTEAAVGEGVTRSTVPRDDVWIATKVLPENLARKDVIRTTEESLERLQIRTIDVHYVHWPTEAFDMEETLGAFDELRDDGLIDRVGVCNFTTELLDAARETLDAPLFAHQIEMHPLLQQPELHEYAREHDIQLVAYCPLARGEIFDVPELTAVAEKHGATEAQVSLAWLVAKENVVAIPGSASRNHIRENCTALDVDLDEADIERIDSIDREHRIVDPPNAPWNR